MQRADGGGGRVGCERGGAKAGNAAAFLVDHDQYAWIGFAQRGDQRSDLGAAGDVAREQDDPGGRRTGKRHRLVGRQRRARDPDDGRPARFAQNVASEQLPPLARTCSQNWVACAMVEKPSARTRHSGLPLRSILVTSGCRLSRSPGAFLASFCHSV